MRPECSARSFRPEDGHFHKSVYGFAVGEVEIDYPASREGYVPFLSAAAARQINGDEHGFCVAGNRIFRDGESRQFLRNFFDFAIEFALPRRRFDLHARPVRERGDQRARTTAYVFSHINQNNGFLRYIKLKNMRIGEALRRPFGIVCGARKVRTKRRAGRYPIRRSPLAFASSAADFNFLFFSERQARGRLRRERRRFPKAREWRRTRRSWKFLRIRPPNGFSPSFRRGRFPLSSFRPRT